MCCHLRTIPITAESIVLGWKRPNSSNIGYTHTHIYIYIYIILYIGYTAYVYMMVDQSSFFPGTAMLRA